MVDLHSVEISFTFLAGSDTFVSFLQVGFEVKFQLWDGPTPQVAHWTEIGREIYWYQVCS